MGTMAVVKKYTTTIRHGQYLTTLRFDFSLNHLPKLKSCPLLMTIIGGFHFTFFHFTLEL
jgi:hypothetical protein